MNERKVVTNVSFNSFEIVFVFICRFCKTRVVEKQEKTAGFEKITFKANRMRLRVVIP